MYSFHVVTLSTPLFLSFSFSFLILFFCNIFYIIGFDCGVFTCMFCDFIAKDCPISLLTQDHINYCRQRIALSILQGNALE